MPYKRTLIVFLLVFLRLPLWAQNELEIHILQLKEKLAEETVMVTQASLLSDLCWSYISISVDSSLKYGRLAVSKAAAAEDDKVAAQAHNDYGIALMLKGDYQAAMTAFREAVHLRQALKDEEGVASLDLKMGNLYFKLSKPDSAMYFYTRALAYFEREGKDMETSVLLGNIGSTYYSIKAYDKSLAYSKRSLTLQQKLGRDAEAAGTWVNIGNIHIHQKDTSKALEAYRQGELAAARANNTSALAAALNNRSNIYLAMGNTQEAKRLVMQALQLRSDLGEAAELASARLTYAILLFSDQKYNLALDELRAAKQIFEKNESLDRLASVYLQMAKVFGEIRASDSLQFYLTKYEQTNAQATAREMLRNTAELEERYQSEKKDAELERSRHKLREWNLMLIGSGLLLGLLAVIGALAVRGQKRKIRLQQKEHAYREALAKAKHENELNEQRIGISRELHDNIGAYLTLLDASIKGLGPASDGMRIQELRDLTGETIAELRKTVWLMNKPVVTGQEWAAKLADFYRRLPQVEVKLGPLPEDLRLNTQQATCLLRVIQEAVSNALRHSGADRVNITVSHREKALEVLVEDKGNGFDPDAQKQGFGLQNMIQRMQEVNGSVKIQSALGHGTKVRVYLPC